MHRILNMQISRVRGGILQIGGSMDVVSRFQIPPYSRFSSAVRTKYSTPHLVNFCATPRVWSTDSLTEKEILRKDGEIKPWKVALWLSGLTLAIVCYGVPGTDWRSPGLRCGRSRSCSPGPLSHG